MIAIFFYYIDNFIKVFVDNFSVFGFDVCLTNMSTLLKRCEGVTLVQSWEKSHFIVQEWIVLG